MIRFQDLKHRDWTMLLACPDLLNDDPPRPIFDLYRRKCVRFFPYIIIFFYVSNNNNNNKGNSGISARTLSFEEIKKNPDGYP